MNVLRIWAFFVVLVLLGCGSSSDYGVTGRITLDGEPLADATVTFLPIDDQLQPALARTDADGMYTAEVTSERYGMKVGTYIVRISTYDEGDPDADPPLPAVRERVPSKYNYDSKLEVEVKPEKNVVNFDLDSKGRIE